MGVVYGPGYKEKALTGVSSGLFFKLMELVFNKSQQFVILLQL